MEKAAEREIIEGVTQLQVHRRQSSKWLFIRVTFRQDLQGRMFSLHL